MIIQALRNTQEISGVLKQFFFARPADRAGRESTTLSGLSSVSLL